MRLVPLVLSAAIALPGAVAAAAEAEVILDRRADEVSLYIAMDTPLLPQVFGQGAEALLGPDGTVDIDRLYDGTFFAADDIFQNVGVRIGGVDVPVEALSMMLHDPDYLPAFADPIDGQVSIAVCTSPETVRGMGLPELRAYMGFFAWKVDGHGAIEIVFPETGRDDLVVTLRDHVDFERMGERVITVADGGTIAVQPAAALQGAGSPVAPLIGIGAAVLLLLAGGGLAIRGSGRRLGRT